MNTRDSSPPPESGNTGAAPDVDLFWTARKVSESGCWDDAASRTRLWTAESFIYLCGLICNRLLGECIPQSFLDATRPADPKLDVLPKAEQMALSLESTRGDEDLRKEILQSLDDPSRKTRHRHIRDVESARLAALE